MQRYPISTIAIAIAASAVAGFVDAFSFTQFGGFFASFMSGNTTRLGVAIGTSVPDVAIAAIVMILAFLGGVIGSSFIAYAWPAHRKAAVMAAVTLMLLIAATLRPARLEALALLAAAMGMENGVFSRNGDVTIPLTYMTGALVRLGQRIAAALLGEDGRWSWLPYLAIWLGFLCGVCAGAAGQAAWGWQALWCAVIGGALLTVVLALGGKKLDAQP